MAENAEKKRQRLSQDLVPNVSVRDAMRIPLALADSYGKDDATPLKVAKALEMTPTSGPFRTLAGAAKAYGLTTGGPNAGSIGLTELGRRAVAPLEEGDDLAAQREAALVPSVQRAFLEKYNHSALPKAAIAMNVLEDFGIPESASRRALETILENAKDLGFVSEIKDKEYVDLSGSQPRTGTANDGAEDSGLGDLDESKSPLDDSEEVKRLGSEKLDDSTPNRKVFVSHGSNKRIVQQLKDLLTFGEFEPVVAEDRESVSKPVSDKVFDAMRLCSAGIIHVSPEDRLLDKSGAERPVLNENVLIEIGAAMALYPRRFILLVEDGTNLPSNLKGLYEVRYTGDELDYEATMKVLKALNEFKSYK